MLITATSEHILSDLLHRHRRSRSVSLKSSAVDGGDVLGGRRRIVLVGFSSQQLVQDLLEGAAEDRAGEVVDQRVEDAVEVGEAHGRVEGQVGLLEVSALVVPDLQDPDGDARHGAGEEAGDEDEGHGEDELDGPLDLPPLVHGPVVVELPGDPDGAEGHDGGGQEELDDVEGVVPGGERREAHADVEALALRAVAVEEEVLVRQEVPGRQEDQGPEPQRHPHGVDQAQAVDGVLRVHDLEVAVDGHGREEEDAGRSVGRQQEEEDAAGHVPVDPVLAAPVVVGPEGQAEQDDGVRHGQLCQVHGVGLPRVHVEDEHPQRHGVPQEPEHELQDEDGGQDPVQDGSLEGAANI